MKINANNPGVSDGFGMPAFGIVGAFMLVKSL